MFIVTAKFDKRKIIGGALILVVLVAAAILLFSGGKDGEPASLTAVVRSNDQRVSYLESLGWLVTAKPIDEQTITIPRDFSDVYRTYNELQMAQGFDLTKYAGLEAVRYTYEVTNHPSATGSVVADIIVYRNEIIAGDIQCVSADGFMAGLSFPAV